MAGKLNPEEVKSVLETLSGVTESLGSCITSLGECQKMLDKSIKCQVYLNHSLKPIQTGFVTTEAEKNPSGAAAV